MLLFTLVSTLGAPTLTPPMPSIESTDAASAGVSWTAADAAAVDSPITGYIVAYKTVDCVDGENTPRERWERSEVRCCGGGSVLL